ncbi:MAG: SMC-Scp complex subunit ScpB [Candidatus Pacearchaeota archaeon]
MAITSKSQKELDDAEEINNLKKVEAALFISARWMSVQDLVGLTDLNPLLLKELLGKLRDNYNNNESAIEILEKNNLWKMDVRQEFNYMVNKLATGSAEFSKAEQETLAIIAFKQPVKQSVVTKIRGNKSYDHIKKFMDLELVKKKKVGHTYELSLSEDFYDYFNIDYSSVSGDSQNPNEGLESGEENTKMNEEGS